MRKFNTEKVNPTAAVSTVTVAYVALVTGLKLDGLIGVCWTLLLAPLWGPIAMLFGLLALLAVAWLVLWCIVTIGRKSRGGL